MVRARERLSSRGSYVLDRGCAGEQVPGIEVPIDALSCPEDWDEFFDLPGPFHVEIGAGRDPFLLDIADEYPGRRLLGIEYSRERLERLARKILWAGSRDIKLVHCEAVKCIARFLAPESVEHFYIFFPDPWPKKRHETHRLVCPPMARLLASRLAPGGRVFLKTDDEAYSRQMVAVLEHTPFLRNEFGPGVFAPPEGFLAHETLFERKWRKLGKRIYPLVYVRTREP